MPDYLLIAAGSRLLLQSGDALLIADAAVPVPAYFLLESGDNLLLESGDDYLLESSSDPAPPATPYLIVYASGGQYVLLWASTP